MRISDWSSDVCSSDLVTLASLRAAIGIVTQEPALFDDTVRANIAYGRPDATEDETAAAARSAAAHDFLMALADGYETLVGEQAHSMSLGAPPRIAIAAPRGQTQNALTPTTHTPVLHSNARYTTK